MGDARLLGYLLKELFRRPHQPTQPMGWVTVWPWEAGERSSAFTNSSQGQTQPWVQTPGSLAAPGSCPLFSGERTFRLQDGGQKPWARQSQMGKEPQGTRVAAAAEGQSST